MSKLSVTSGFKIMVIDDDPFLLEVAIRLLEPRGHKVTPINDAKTALFLLPQTEPDVILLDVGLPGMDGFGFLAEIKAKPLWNRVPVIMMTGHVERESVERALKLGAVDYIAKPLDPERLLARLDRLAKMRAQDAAHHGVAWSTSV